MNLLYYMHLVIFMISECNMRILRIRISLEKSPMMSIQIKLGIIWPSEVESVPLSLKGD